ncbi:MAG TPA: DUF3422 domain-containing protein [Candidatus Sulfotelmatobacter sp.]|jgi:uncharacterized membrane-anchored protein|nr:DUF3422 domain-containing protein [Candidatus Sulfotelmatobacter sp.]
MSAEAPAPAAWIEHPLRRSIANEVHARPFELLPPPMRASHLALATGEQAVGADLRHMEALCARFGVEPPAEGAIYFTADFGAFRLRWERHTEFSTYTLYRFDAFDAPFATTALDLCPADWLAELPGQLLVAVHVALDNVRRDADALSDIFTGHPINGSTVVAGRAQVFTDFHIHQDGFGRILIYDQGLTHGQAGRLTQRLLEIETYRILALLAFPLARKLGPDLTRMTEELSAIMSGLAGPEGDEADRELLGWLSALAARAEHLGATHNYRFTAAKAYGALVDRRIEELNEARIVGMQSLGGFLNRRFWPALQTCESAAKRHSDLTKHITRAGSLLRTRVDIALEEKNRDLLKSMNKRAELQLRLQETVEGLSVVAISYYCLGLLGYLAKGLKAAGLHIDSDLTVLFGVPVVLGLVVVGVRRLKKAVVKGH